VFGTRIFSEQNQTRIVYNDTKGFFIMNELPEKEAGLCCGLLVNSNMKFN